MKDSKSLLYKSLALFIVVATISLIYCLFWGPGYNWGTSFIPARTMLVSASDFKYVTPDIALLSFSVISEGKDIKLIINKNNKIINSVNNYLNELKILGDDIKTTEYRLKPIYTQSNPQFYNSNFVPEISKYRLTQSFEVKIRDFDLASKIVSKLPNFGVNKINGISFTIEDRSKYIDEIRKSAFKKAREKAEKIAKENNIKLGRIIKISINENPYYTPYSDLKYSMISSGSYGSNRDVEIKPGTQKLQISTSIKYEIK